MIYLDAAATTPVKREVIEAMFPWLTSNFGNPSSHHELGQIAAAGLADARSSVALTLGAHSEEIIFTSGGTEADNAAVKGIAQARRRREPSRNRVLVGATEHAAVLESAKYLEEYCGFTVDVVPVDSQGRTDIGRYSELLAEDVALVSIMYANNEVGTVSDISTLAKMAHDVGAAMHSDCVQAPGWLPLNVETLGVDALSLSGHKIGAPKACGALYLRAGTDFVSLVHGGGQENGKRSGTESVALAVAFATALAVACGQQETVSQSVSELRDRFAELVTRNLPWVIATGHPSSRLANVASFCFPKLSGESLLLELENQGIFSSSGSACAAGSDQASHVLVAMGIPEVVGQTALRFSFSADISAEQLDATAKSLVAGVERVLALGGAKQA